MFPSKAIPTLRALGSFRQRFLSPHFLRLTENSCVQRRAFSILASEKLRNVGIIAHIDAGKTTTTERILFYAGVVRNIGEVHDGDTTMDYLEQERERGHVDFTVEVERSMRVLDGAAIIFDGVAGVEAQTETVWKQAKTYGVPCIAFVNKLDREGANLERTIQMMTEKLETTPLLLQLPIIEGDTYNEAKVVKGVIDLVSLEKLVWSQNKNSKEYERTPFEPFDDDRIMNAREELAEQLALLDDNFAEIYMDHDNSIGIPKEDFVAALKRVTAKRHAVPVLCGSALKNTGVQPLMDAFVDLLPSPFSLELSKPKMKDNFKALAFKVQNDKIRGPLVFLRIYSGVLNTKDVVFNVSQGGIKERVNALLRVAADETESIDSAGPGDIAVVVGLKNTRTGDTIALDRDMEPMEGLNLPKPVFTGAIEIESASEEEAFQEALSILTRDDPSLTLTPDEETGQLVLGGMGELHLEIAIDRLRSEFGLDCELGRVRVAYRESILDSLEHREEFDVTVGTATHDGFISLRLNPHPEGLNAAAKVDVLPDQRGKSHKKTNEKDHKQKRIVVGMGDTTTMLTKDQENAIFNGIRVGINRGPKLGYPLQGVVVEIDTKKTFVSKDTPPSVLHGAAALAASRLIRKKGTEAVILEPFASLQVIVPEQYVGAVISDLTSAQKRGEIHDVSSDLTQKDRSVIIAQVPLNSLVGYSTLLRSISRGEGTFSIEVDSYGVVSEEYIDK